MSTDKSTDKSNECTHNCDTCNVDCSSRDQAQSLQAPPHPLASVKKVIAVVSGKGGVGKSMVTSLLAVTMQRRGLQVGILDADITGPSIPQAFGLKEKAKGDQNGMFPVQTKTGIQVMSTNLLLKDTTDPVIWRGPVIAGTMQQFWTEVIWKDVDYLFVDLPPGTGDVPLTVFQSLPVDGIIVVTSPQQLVGMIVEKAVKMANLMNIPILGLVENLSYYECPDCHTQLPIFGESHVTEIAQKYNIPHVAKLPIDSRLTRACDQGMIELFEGDWLEDLADKI